VFVETLDRCFENVCELDLIFHPDRVHFILDEVVMGGLVLETGIGEVLEAIGEMAKLEEATRAASIKA
jgi:AP-3 complex subunit sigma